MENLIREMIEKAEYYYFDLNQYDEARELIEYVKRLIGTFASTMNCPSNWRYIGDELAREIDNDTWTFEALELWDYEEV